MNLKATAAVSNFIGCFSCGLELAGILPPFSGKLMSIQFIVIHSSAFVFFIPFMNIPESFKPAVLKALIAGYTCAAFYVDGIFGILQFAGLTYAAYSGYVLKRDGEAARIPLILRWAGAFAVFIVSMAVIGAPSDVDKWAGDRRLALMGVVYFGLIGLLEASHVYEAGWKNLLRRIAQKDPQFREHMPGWLAKELYKQEK